MLKQLMLFGIGWMTAALSGPAFAGQAVGWFDDFDRPILGEAWIPTSAADFNEKIVDVVDGRVRLRADTMETDDSTVKYLGVRSAREFEFRTGEGVSVELDWNGQSNGSYLTAGLVISPARTDGDPFVERDWLKVEYVGVPPGKNGRVVVGTRLDGRERRLYSEGWPQTNREGRPIGLQKISVRWGTGGAFEVFENGEPIFRSEPGAIDFDRGHIYLQMSSHSNYRARELFFDDVRIGR